MAANITIVSNTSPINDVKTALPTTATAGDLVAVKGADGVHVLFLCSVTGTGTAQWTRVRT